jgi:channel protein (hemolysin III family)
MKPRLRGVFHQYAFFVSLGSGILLVLLAATTRASVAAAVYAASVSALFGVSALYHRVTCRPDQGVDQARDQPELLKQRPEGHRADDQPQREQHAVHAAP